VTPEPGPSVTGVSPSSGASAGGTQVTISGTGFRATTRTKTKGASNG
jgi:hypothetical protein